MREKITIDSLMNNGELPIYTCDEIEDQNISDDDYYLVTDNLTEKECEQSLYYISDYPRLINKFKEKFGKKKFHSYFIREFIKNSKYNEETQMYEYESDNLSDFIIGTYMIDQIINLYKNYEHEDIYFSGFTLGDMSSRMIIENCFIYNKKFSDNRIINNPDSEIATLMYNTNIPLNSKINIFNGLVKNNNLLYYRILMYAPDKECFREYEIPYIFTMHYKIPEDLVRILIFNNNDIIENIKDEEIFFHTYF